MAIDKDTISQAMRRVPSPAGPLDLVASGVFVWASACDGFVSVKLRPLPDAPDADRRALASQVHGAIVAIGGPGS